MKHALTILFFLATVSAFGQGQSSFTITGASGGSGSGLAGVSAWSLSIDGSTGYGKIGPLCANPTGPCVATTGNGRITQFNTVQTVQPGAGSDTYKVYVDNAGTMNVQYSSSAPAACSTCTAGTGAIPQGSYVIGAFTLTSGVLTVAPSPVASPYTGMLALIQGTNMTIVCDASGCTLNATGAAGNGGGYSTLSATYNSGSTYYFPLYGALAASATRTNVITTMGQAGTFAFFSVAVVPAPAMNSNLTWTLMDGATGEVVTCTWNGNGITTGCNDGTHSFAYSASDPLSIRLAVAGGTNYTGTVVFNFGTGATGPQGPAGSTGAAGPTGATGPAGPAAVHQFSFVFGGQGGAALTTSSISNPVPVLFNCTIGANNQITTPEWRITFGATGDTGSVTIKIGRVNDASTTLPTSGNLNTSGLTGTTETAKGTLFSDFISTAVTGGDTLQAFITAITGTLSNVTETIPCQ